MAGMITLLLLFSAQTKRTLLLSFLVATFLLERDAVFCAASQLSTPVFIQPRTNHLEDVSSSESKDTLDRTEIPNPETGQSVLHGKDSAADVKPFSWSNITPSSSLAFTPCYGTFTCARLSVPLDYDDASNTQTAAIAIVRRRARIPMSSPRYGGTVILMPGAPGTSGVGYALRAGVYHQFIIDDNYGMPQNITSGSIEGLSFDIVAFDPRGVNNTTPFHSCFDRVEDRIRSFTDAEKQLESQQEVYEQMIAEVLQRNQDCQSPVAEHMGIATVVQDMVQIVEALGEWRESRAKRLGDINGPSLQHLKWKVGREPLQYWGSSYGSLLGATFATMYPQRVHRMLLDAMPHADTYFGALSTRATSEMDALAENLFEYCSAAGPDLCPMAKNTSSPADIKQKVASLLERLTIREPLWIPASNQTQALLVTSTLIQTWISETSQRPMILWRVLVSVLAPLLNRERPDGVLLAALHGAMSEFGVVANPDCPDMIDRHDPDCNHVVDARSGAGTAISCGDLPPSTDSIFNQTARLLHDLSGEHSRNGTLLAFPALSSRLQCLGWPYRAKRQVHQAIGSNSTAQSILWMGNTLDHVAPVSNSRQMAARFNVSRLLETNIEGHTIMANPNLCAMKAIREYFQKGTLPPDGMRCLPHGRPLLGAHGPNVEKLPAELNKEDGALVYAMERLLRQIL